MIKHSRFEEALWLINEQQFQIQVKKKRVEEILSMIQHAFYDNIERSFQLALEKLNNQLSLQLKGIAELMKYIHFYQE